MCGGGRGRRLLRWRLFRWRRVGGVEARGWGELKGLVGGLLYGIRGGWDRCRMIVEVGFEGGYVRRTVARDRA